MLSNLDGLRAGDDSARSTLRLTMDFKSATMFSDLFSSCKRQILNCRNPEDQPERFVTVTTLLESEPDASILPACILITSTCKMYNYRARPPWFAISAFVLSKVLFNIIGAWLAQENAVYMKM